MQYYSCLFVTVPLAVCTKLHLLMYRCVVVECIRVNFNNDAIIIFSYNSTTASNGIGLIGHVYILFIIVLTNISLAVEINVKQCWTNGNFFCSLKINHPFIVGHNQYSIHSVCTYRNRTYIHMDKIDFECSYCVLRVTHSMSLIHSKKYAKNVQKFIDRCNGINKFRMWLHIQYGWRWVREREPESKELENRKKRLKNAAWIRNTWSQSQAYNIIYTYTLCVCVEHSNLRFLLGRLAIRSLNFISVTFGWCWTCAKHF